MYIDEHCEVSEDLITTIMQLDQDIFETPYTREKLESSLKARSGLMILVALVNGVPAGYKIGYEMSPSLFYSYLGGVHPSARGRGVAKALMARQHELARERGYQLIRTHTENRFRQMLLFNIKAGFDIIGTFKSSSNDNLRIILEKSLLD